MLVLYYIRVFTRSEKGVSGIHGRLGHLDMEFSDVMSLGDLTALKLRFGWDTGEFTGEDCRNYNINTNINLIKWMTIQAVQVHMQ